MPRLATGGVDRVLSNYFLLFLKHVNVSENNFYQWFYYVDRQWKSISTDSFFNSTASGNRFSLAVLNYPPIKMMISTGP
jgi:hypothetical protein